ncbi:MAG: NUDIX domain-containing protein [Alphaproteobacteria bacterium]|nr:NUDIX domain-containing protein [Alphaproteobacteria bacterium]
MPGPRYGRRCAAALLVTEAGRYLMQRRDAHAWIDFPEVWASFGGAIEPEETPLAAMRRELVEEIGYAARRIERFTEFRVTMPFAPPRREQIIFFVVPIAESEIPGLVLNEGAGLGLFRPEELACEAQVAPWDLAAVLMHARRHSLFRPKAPRPTG